MRSFLSGDAWKKCENNGVMQQNQHACLKSSDREHGFIEIGKLNLVLIALIGVILLTLLSQDHPGAEKADSPLHAHRQPATGITDTISEESLIPEEEPVSAGPTEASVASGQEQEEEQQENDVPMSPATEKHARQTTPAVKTPSHPAKKIVTETHTRQATAQTDASRHTIVFSIWSVSELRLRSAYTKGMNDSAVPSAKQQRIKKDYLDFVNRRTQKCGELDNKFASNINTVEKLTFDEKSVKILECHTSENISELDRLSALGVHHS